MKEKKAAPKWISGMYFTGAVLFALPYLIRTFANPDRLHWLAMRIPACMLLGAGCLLDGIFAWQKRQQGEKALSAWKLAEMLHYALLFLILTPLVLIIEYRQELLELSFGERFDGTGLLFAAFVIPKLVILAGRTLYEPPEMKD